MSLEMGSVSPDPSGLFSASPGPAPSPCDPDHTQGVIKTEPVDEDTVNECEATESDDEGRDAIEEKPQETKTPVSDLKFSITNILKRDDTQVMTRGREDDSGRGDSGRSKNKTHRLVSSLYCGNFKVSTRAGSAEKSHLRRRSRVYRAVEYNQ